MSADIDHIKALAALLNEINGDDDDDDYDILGTTPRGAIIANNSTNDDDKSNDDNDEVMTPQAFITDAPGSSQQQQQRRELCTTTTSSSSIKERQSEFEKKQHERQMKLKATNDKIQRMERMKLEKTERRREQKQQQKQSTANNIKSDPLSSSHVKEKSSSILQSKNNIVLADISQPIFGKPDTFGGANVKQRALAINQWKIIKSASNEENDKKMIPQQKTMKSSMGHDRALQWRNVGNNETNNGMSSSSSSSQYNNGTSREIRSSNERVGGNSMIHSQISGSESTDSWDNEGIVASWSTDEDDDEVEDTNSNNNNSSSSCQQFELLSKKNSSCGSGMNYEAKKKKSVLPSFLSQFEQQHQNNDEAEEKNDNDEENAAINGSSNSRRTSSSSPSLSSSRRPLMSSSATSSNVPPPSASAAVIIKNRITDDDKHEVVDVKKEETYESITSTDEEKVVYYEGVEVDMVDDISTVDEEEAPPSPPTPSPAAAAAAAAANEEDINIRAYNLLNKAKQACEEYTIETVVESPHVHNHTMTMEEFISPPAAVESDGGMERKEEEEEEVVEQVVYNELNERVDADLILVTSSLSEVMDEAMNLLSSEVNNVVKDDDGQLVLTMDRFVINNENENEEQMANNTTPKSMTKGSNNDDAETEDDDAVAAFPVNFDSWNDQQQSESHNDNMEGNETVFFQTTFDSTDNNNEQDYMSESPAMKAGNSGTLSSATKKSPHKLKIETSFNNSSVTSYSRKQQAKIKISIKGAAEFKPTEKIKEDMMFYVSQSSPTFGDDTSLLGCSMPQSPAAANIVPAAKARSGRKAIATHSNSKIKIRGFLGNTRSRKKMESAFGSLK